MKFRRLAVSFAAAAAICTSALGTAAVASASTDYAHSGTDYTHSTTTNSYKAVPTVKADPATVCTPLLGMPHNHGLGQPCRHHHHHH